MTRIGTWKEALYGRPKVMRWECSCGAGSNSKQRPDQCVACGRIDTYLEQKDWGRLRTQEEYAERNRQSKEYWAERG